MTTADDTRAEIAEIPAALGALSLDGLSNFRDVAGIPTTSGPVLPGRLYRSDALAALSEAGAAALAASRISTIVDLRSESEVSHMPTPAMLAERVVRLPLLDGSIETAGRLTLEAMYANLLRANGAEFAAAARLVSRADADRAVLVHCTAGKDRTGLVVALSLLAIGADRDAVVANYAETERNLAGPWTERVMGFLATIGVEVDEGMRRVVTASPAETIAGAMDLVDAEYGDAAGYLRAHGLTDGELDALRLALVGAPR